MLLSKVVKVKVTSNMCKYYKEKKYNFKCNDFIEVNIEDLPKGSNAKVLVRCDKCNKEYLLGYFDYNKKKNGDYCFDCRYESTKITNLEKYGYENAFQSPEIRDKQRKTILEKYGCENVFQNNDIKDKIKETFLEKYNAIHPMKNKEYALNIHKKCFKTMYENQSQVCSSQQKYLNKIYGGELNKLYDNLWLDIYFEEDNIYLEYNGSGHDISLKYKKISEEEFKIREIKRYKFLKSKNLKEIVISSKHDKIPKDEVLYSIKKYAFYILKNDYSDWIIFDIDEQEIKFKEHTIKYDFNTPIIFDDSILCND